MNKVRDQIVTPVTDENKVFLSIHVKGTTNESEKVDLGIARLHVIFHSINSIGWNSYPYIKHSKCAARLSCYSAQELKQMEGKGTRRLTLHME